MGGRTWPPAASAAVVAVAGPCAAAMRPIRFMKSFWCDTPTGRGLLRASSRRFLAALLAAGGLFVFRVPAAVVGPAGYSTGFEVRPAVTDWSTKYIQGAQGDVYDLTNAVQALAATNQNVQLVDGGTADPATARANAFWTAGGGAYVATRPAANRCTLLMVTLWNDSGTNAISARIRYDLGIKAASAEPDYPGLRAFYSLSGLSNSWVPIPEFSSPTPVAGPLQADLSFATPWRQGTNLYVLWADDNANNPSGTIQDPAYALDNFFAGVTGGRPAGEPLGVNLTAPTNNAWFFGPNQIGLETDAVQDGTIVRVEFFVDEQKVGEATQSPYRFDWAHPPQGPHTLRAVIGDSYGSSQSSATTSVFVYDALGLPYVKITSPTNGTVWPVPTNVVLSALASAWDGVTNVRFLANGTNIGDLGNPPYNLAWRVPYGSSDLTALALGANGQANTSAVVSVFIQPPPTDLAAPSVAGQLPAAGATLTSLTSLQVVFSEVVTNLRASDLLVNGLPAGGVTGTGSNYTFTFTQPAYGAVAIAWAANHNITDLAYPAWLRFDESGPGATWTYTLVDRTPPTIQSRNPVAGAASLTLAKASVTFSEPVTGVEAADFLVNGVPATNLVGGGATYTFFFTQPPLGEVVVSWAANHGITDLATVPNAFDATGPGATWTYIVGIPMQTGNDNFVDRIPLAGTPVSVLGSNVGTTTEPGEPTGNGFFRYGNTVWWSWTAPANGTVRLDTFGSTFNTELGVFTGSSVNSLRQIVLNDNAPGSADVSLVTFTAVQGTEYQIQVSGAPVFAFPPVPPASGTIRLNLSMPPSVALTSPSNGAVILAGAPIPLTAIAAAQGGTVTRVDFYRAGSLVATVTEPPYAATLVNAPVGSNALCAVVTDSSSQIATSAVVNVLVANLGITLTSPADGAVFANTNPITVGTVTVLGSGTITNVEFFVDGFKFAEDNLAPSSGVWSAVSPGSHRLTAIGQADTGESFASQGVYIGVARVLVRSNSVWKYLDNGSDQGTAWRAPGFDDSAWASGPAQLGYGDGDEATVVASGPTNNYYTTTYFRRAFILSNVASYASLQINVQRDDGAVVYLNGVETGRYNMNAGEVTAATWAPNANDDGVGFFPGTAPASLLVEGTNVLAVEIHQTSATSTDISFDLEMLGVPRIVRNQPPSVALTNPTNTAFYLAPADLMLTAEATDPDGTVTKLEFFLGGTKLGEATHRPYALALPQVPAGSYSFTAVATDDQGATTVSARAVVQVYDLASRWVAYNDHYAGPTTHPNATAWNVFGTAGGAPGFGGSLRNVQTGAVLPASLTLVAVGTYGDPVCGAPGPGTPAYGDFHGYVDFGSGGVNHAILVPRDGWVRHEFAGLDPARRYRLRATVVGGVEAYSNRWTVCALVGADSSVPAHTAGVLTSATQPGLTLDQAAFNSGDNRVGEVVGWDHMAPGSDGAVTLLSSQYLGPAPGNAVPGAAGLAPVAIRLEETAPLPLVRLTAPRDGAVITGPTNVTLTAEASALSGISQMLFLADGVVLGGVAAGSGSLVWSNPPFGDHALTAAAVDTQGLASTSAPVTLHLVTPPTNTIAPYVTATVPGDDATVTNLTQIQVFFSQTVVGVAAPDLLINGVPATNVAGSGSNYLFSLAQPAYGNVVVSWASNAAIHDLSWPENLPFATADGANAWSYLLVDRTPPTVVGRSPAAGSTLTNLTQISVTFSEPVDGVAAEDLLVNGVPAFGLAGGGAAYTFTFSQPASGTVNVSWAANHGITDRAVAPNPFNATNAGATWTYTLDARTILMQSNANWLFVKGTSEASTPASAWRQLAFDDSAWSNAPAPFFYGDPYSNGVAAYTLLSDMRSNYTTVYLRQVFTVTNRTAITNLWLNAQSDDGFIAWLNGVEVWRYNVPAGELAFGAVASSAAPEPQNNGAAYISSALTNGAPLLVNGPNVLAVQAINESLTASSDFGFNAQLYTYLTDPALIAPRLVQAEPAPGDLLVLTNLTLTFSEAVTNVDAADLLVNGVPAASLTTTNPAVYSFGFTQPAFGNVLVTWATNHGILDHDVIPKPFNGAAASSILHYTLFNPASPRVLSQSPVAGGVLTGLTAITVTFTKPVTGVDAADLLVNGLPATGLTTLDSSTRSFTFAQPAYGTIAIRWATNHGISDLAVPPNQFDPTVFGGEWSYTLVNPVPSVAITSPTDGAYVLEPATVSLNATASDNDGVIARVEFFAGGAKLGEVTTPPYNLTWTNVEASEYVLRAVATDNSGLKATSAPVVLKVVATLPAVLLRGPYLQSGTPTGGIVRWRTDLFSAGVVRYGTDLARLTNLASEAASTNNHIVQLGGLQADTLYYYAIFNEGVSLAGGSNYWFKTSPLPGTRRPVRIWGLGDSGTAGYGLDGSNNAVNVREAFYRFAATNGQPDLWLMLGDNAYDSGTDAQHQVALFEMYPKTLRNLFLWPTIGNHETAQATSIADFPYLQIFSLPQNGEAGGAASGTPRYYSFDYANVHFVCLDSMTSGRTTNTAMGQWLINDLGATTQDWVIVFFHHPPYTKGNHDSDRETELIQIRQNFNPIFEANGVDLVLCGHSHNLERSYLLNGHYGLSTTLTAAMKIDAGSGREDGTGAYRKNSQGEGVVYMVAGSSGQITGGSLNHPAHFISINQLGSTVLDFNGRRLDVKFLGTNGTFLDHYTVLKDLPAPPAAPTQLLAVGLDTNRVSLSWTDTAANEARFALERSLDGTLFSEVLTTAANVTNATEAGLLANTTYYYRVRAVNAKGASDYSAVAAATTIAAASLPLAPADLLAEANNGLEFYRSQIVLHWRDRSSNSSSFLIERSTDGLSFAPLTTVGANMTHFLDRGLDSATVYYYRVRGWNGLGTSTPSAPADEQTHPQDSLVAGGGTAVFHAGVEGQPTVRYQWRFEGTALPGETNEMLTLRAVSAGNEGAYTVVLSDSSGPQESNPAHLFVAAPPVIAAQPLSRTNLLGSTATFSVGALGDGPFGYQWRRNGVALAAPSGNTLALVGVQLSDQGGYDVIVQNSYGAVTSQVAQLTVNRPPVAVADTVYRPAGENLSIPVASLLANDFDPDGEPIVLAGVATNSLHGGTVQLTGGTISYVAPAGFNSADAFAYTISDPRGGAASALVSIAILAGTLPRIDAIHAQAAHQVGLSLYLPANRAGTVEFSPTLPATTWTAVTNFPASATSQGLQAILAAPGNSGFYRVRAP